MLTKLSSSLFLGLALLAPATLLAGGPPRLCLPIDGVSEQNAAACGKLLATKLAEKVWRHGNADQAVKIRQYENQWYFTFPMEQDVSLSEIETALKGSAYRIPRDKLRFFGHVILELDAAGAPAPETLAGLDAIPFVAVEKPAGREKQPLVTIDMPYPTNHSDEELELATFKRNDLSTSERGSESPAKAGELPSLAVLQKQVAEHGGKLQDVRWSTEFACRLVGGVGVQETSQTTAVRRTEE